MIITVEVEVVPIEGVANLPPRDIVRYIDASVSLALTIEERANLEKLGWKVTGVVSGEA